LEIPVIHVVLVYRKLKSLGSEAWLAYWKAMHAAQARWTADAGAKEHVREHNIEGSPGTQIIPSSTAKADTSSTARSGSTASTAPICASCWTP